MSKCPIIIIISLLIKIRSQCLNLNLFWITRSPNTWIISHILQHGRNRSHRSPRSRMWWLCHTRAPGHARWSRSRRSHSNILFPDFSFVFFRISFVYFMWLEGPLNHQISSWNLLWYLTSYIVMGKPLCWILKTFFWKSDPPHGTTQLDHNSKMSKLTTIAGWLSCKNSRMPNLITIVGWSRWSQ